MKRIDKGGPCSRLEMHHDQCDSFSMLPMMMITGHAWDEFVSDDDQTWGSLVIMIRHWNDLTGGKARGYDQLGSSHMALMELESPEDVLNHDGNDYDPEDPKDL